MYAQQKFSCFFHWLLPPRNVNTLLLNTWAKSTISDSLICRDILTSCQKNVRLLDNLFVTSTVKVAFSRLFVNARRAWLEYFGCETSLFKSMSTSRISRVLANKTEKIEKMKFQYNQIEKLLRKCKGPFRRSKKTKLIMRIKEDSNSRWWTSGLSN